MQNASSIILRDPQRMIRLGQRVRRESIEAAAQYIRAYYSILGVATDWCENFDIAVLATMMTIPKGGPLAGITITTGIVSALKNIPVRHYVAMTGEITIMGKVLGVGGNSTKINSCHRFWCEDGDHAR